jgi:hypothetical protein
VKRRVRHRDLRGDAGGDVVGANVDARPGVDCGDLPGHCHGASVGRVVGNEVDGRHRPHTRDDVDKKSSTMSESVVALPRALEASA